MDYSNKTKEELLEITHDLLRENDALKLRLNAEMTHLNLAENKVKLRDDQVREIFENSLDAAYKRNLISKKYEYFSPAFTTISGYTPEEFLKLLEGNWIDQMIHPDDISNIEDALVEIFSSDTESGQFEYRFKHKDGSYRWFLDRFKVMRGDANEPIALIGTISDITKRKLAEESLWQSEEKFRNLAENLSELLFQADPITTRATYVNKAVEKIYGYTAEEWLNDPGLWVNSLHPDDKVWVLNEYSKAQGKFDDLVLSYRIIKKDNAVRWVEASTRWVKGKSGNVIDIIGLIYDITERLTMEKSLKELHYRSIFEHAPFGIALVNSITGEIYEVNPMFAKIAGRTIAEIATIEWTRITHPEDVQVELDHLGRLLKGDINGFQMEKRYIRSDGSIVWIKLTVSHLIKEENMPLRHVCMVEEIKPLKSATHKK